MRFLTASGSEPDPGTPNPARQGCVRSGSLALAVRTCVPVPSRSEGLPWGLRSGLDELDADPVRPLDERDPRARAEVPRLDLDEDAALPELGDGRVNVGNPQPEMVGPEVLRVGRGQPLVLAGRPQVDVGAAKLQPDARHTPRLGPPGDIGAEPLGEPLLSGGHVGAEHVDVVKREIERASHRSSSTSVWAAI